MRRSTPFLALLSLAGLASGQPDNQHIIATGASTAFVPKEISIPFNVDQKHRADAVTVGLYFNQSGNSSAAVEASLRAQFAALSDEYLRLAALHADADADALDGFTNSSCSLTDSPDLSSGQETGIVAGTLYATAVFSTLEPLDEFKAAFPEGVEAQWLDWSLSPARKAEATRGLRRAALEEVADAGRAYAELFGRELRMTAFGEESMWVSSYDGGYYGREACYYGVHGYERQAVSWSPSKVSLQIAGTAKFEIVA